MTEQHTSIPRVGVGVFVYRSRSDSNFLLGLRKGSHGSGTWSLPGGHLEYNETFTDCAIREIKEETDLDIEAVEFLTAVESFFVGEERHYVTVLMTAVVKEGEGEAKLMEPDKCEGWEWRTFDHMRELNEGQEERLFLPLRNLFTQRAELCRKMDRR